MYSSYETTADFVQINELEISQLLFAFYRWLSKCVLTTTFIKTFLRLYDLSTPQLDSSDFVG